MKRKAKKSKASKRSLSDYREDNVHLTVSKALAYLNSYKDGWINTTGNCVKSDYVIFARSYLRKVRKNYRITYCEIIEGLIIDEFYDENNFVHFFRILRTDNKQIIKITGAMLYKHMVLRKVWKDEELRKLVVAEKIIRGDVARFDRKYKNDQARRLNNPRYKKRL